MASRRAAEPAGGSSDDHHGGDQRSAGGSRGAGDRPGKLGVNADLLADVGVAGIHRLLRHQHEFTGADAVIVAAGMDGALPSVVGGLVDCPVIAVPTSIGYGAAFGGLAALLTMLNACSANVVVVNIDSGFKAGYVAALIARRPSEPEAPKRRTRIPGGRGFRLRNYATSRSTRCGNSSPLGVGSPNGPVGPGLGAVPAMIANRLQDLLGDADRGQAVLARHARRLPPVCTQVMNSCNSHVN